MKDNSNNSSLTPKFHDRIQSLRLMDDIFMTVFFKNNHEAAELLIRTIIDKADLKIKNVTVQQHVENFGHSIILDIFAKDSDGKLYDIEFQRHSQGASPRRLRYYASMIDAATLKPGNDYDQLPEKYIIFITEDDYFKKGEPLYKFCNTLIHDKIKMVLDDGQYYIYVNGANKDNTPLGNLIQDLKESDPEKMHYQILKDRVSYYKNDKEGEIIMGNVMEELLNEGRKEGRTEGVKKERKNGIKTLISALKSLSLPKEDIVKSVADSYNLSTDEASRIVSESLAA